MRNVDRMDKRKEKQRKTSRITSTRQVDFKSKLSGSHENLSYITVFVSYKIQQKPWMAALWSSLRDLLTVSIQCYTFLCLIRCQRLLFTILCTIILSLNRSRVQNIFNPLLRSFKMVELLGLQIWKYKRLIKLSSVVWSARCLQNRCWKLGKLDFVSAADFIVSSHIARLKWWNWWKSMREISMCEYTVWLLFWRIAILIFLLTSQCFHVMHISMGAYSKSYVMLYLLFPKHCYLT
jgi:hypothetical protein